MKYGNAQYLSPEDRDKHVKQVVERKVCFPLPSYKTRGIKH